MLKIDTVSDLHLEFYSPVSAYNLVADLPKTSDTIVLAGDIIAPTWAIRWSCLDWFCDRWKNVLYVPGNHEYWGHNAPTLVKLIRKEVPRLTLLEPGDVKVIDGYRFMGGSGFYPDCKDEWLKRGFIDYYRSVNFEPWVYKHNRAFKRRVLKQMQPGDIIISHHAPSHNSIADSFKGDPGNFFFCNDWDDLIRDRQPALWLHGHTHTPMDYSLYDTRVYCNPYGYINEGENPDVLRRISIKI